MGRSSWHVLIRSKVDAEALIDAVRRHNMPPDADGYAHVGEVLTITCVRSLMGVLCACLSNAGGRDITSTFLEGALPQRMKIYHPFQAPKKLLKCTEYAWELETREAPFESYEDMSQYALARFEQWAAGLEARSA